MLYDGLDALHISDGSGMHISHIGFTSLTISNFNFQLKDVLFVLNFTKKLLSLSKLLQDNSILIEFCSHFFVVKERHTMSVILQARLVNGLYMVPSQPILAPQVFIGERVSADLWLMLLLQEFYLIIVYLYL